MSAAFGRDVAEKLRHRIDLLGSRSSASRSASIMTASSTPAISLIWRCWRSFPFFIVAAAVAQLARPVRERSHDRRSRSLRSCRPTSPKCCAHRCATCSAREPGRLLWIGAIVGLWTVGSFIETIRDILRRAYGVKYCAPFWEYRLASMAHDRRRGLLADDRVRGSAWLSSSAQHAIEHGSRLPRMWPDAMTLYRVVPALVAVRASSTSSSSS